jgi:hypothetical protein
MKAWMSNPAPALGRTHRASAGSDIRLVWGRGRAWSAAAALARPRHAAWTDARGAGDHRVDIWVDATTYLGVSSIAGLVLGSKELVDFTGSLNYCNAQGTT